MTEGLRITKSITIKTKSKKESDPPCNWRGDTTCLTFIASPEINLDLTGPMDANIGLIQVLANSVTLDHIILDGNNLSRTNSKYAYECRSGNTAKGYNIQFGGDSLKFIGSVSKNTLCGTAMEVAGLRTNITVSKSSFVNNGFHNQSMLWADGITVHDGRSSTFENNYFLNNTDIDLIFGGCKDCHVFNNKIEHNSDF